MQQPLHYKSGSTGTTSIISGFSTVLNWITHLNVGLDVGSYYHCTALFMMAICSMCFHGCHGSLRIFLLLVNYIVNIHLFCNYYHSLTTLSITLLILSSLTLIVFAFIKLYSGRRIFMETMFTVCTVCIYPASFSTIHRYVFISYYLQYG